MKRYLFTLLFLVLIVASPASSADPEYIAIIPFYAPEKIWKLYSPFIDYLNKTTNVTWALKLYHDHEEMIDGICRGEVSIALLGPAPFISAQRRCGVTPLLVVLGKDGKASYRSYFLTGDPAVKSFRDLKGKKVGFFKGSTAAHLVPERMLAAEGISMEMISPVFLTGQDRIMEALLKHEISAAGVKETLYNKFRGENLTVLKKSEAFPNFAFCATAQLGRRGRTEFVQALHKLKPISNPAHKTLVQGWDDEVSNGFALPSKTFSSQAQKLLDPSPEAGK